MELQLQGLTALLLHFAVYVCAHLGKSVCVSANLFVCVLSCALLCSQQDEGKEAESVSGSNFIAFHPFTLADYSSFSF